MQRVGAWIYSAVSRPTFAPILDQIQLIVHMPEGLALPPYFTDFLQLLTKLPVLSLLEASTQNLDPSSLSSYCYQSMLVCFGNEAVNLTQYGQFLAQYYTGSVPRPPSTQRTLNVVFDARGGSDRQLDNLEDIIQSCSGSVINGVQLRCRARNFSGVASAARDLFADDVLIGMHGAGLANGFLLKPGASVIEILPLGLKRMVPYAERAAADPASQLLWWHLYVCDPSASVPGDHEVKGLKPKWTWPLYRGGKISWTSIEAVLEAIVDLKGNKDKYDELYSRNGHSFFMHSARLRARQGTEADPRDQCPAGSDPAQGSGLKIKNLFGLPVLWEVPPYPRGIVLLLNGEKRNATEWWKPCDACPECQGYMEHVAIKDAALRNHLTVAALCPDKSGPEYENWKLDDTGVARATDGSAYWDDRLNPEASVDAPRLRAALASIVAEESLESLPIYVAGYSSGGRMAWMLPTLMPIRGIYVISAHATPLWLETSMWQTYPQAAIVKMQDQKRNPAFDYITSNIHNLTYQGVPTALTTIYQKAMNVADVQKFLEVDAVVAENVVQAFRAANLTDADYKYRQEYDPELNKTVHTSLAQIANELEIKTDLLVEMALWFQGVHYIYSTNADKIFSWLMDGGVTRFSAG